MVSGSAKEVETPLPDFDSVWKRIQQRAGVKKQYELAAILGIASSNISDAKNRGTFPLEWAYKLASGLDISLDWLLRGKEKKEEGVLQEPGRVHRGQSRKVADQACDPDLVLVPKVRARLSAGGGSLETNAEVKGRYAFKAEWIRSKGKPGQMVLMDVAGDSMEPVICDGDTVLIDQSQHDILPGKIFAVGIDELVYLKRIDAQPGMLVLKSENKEYEPVLVHLGEDHASSVRVIGRVVWWCREAR